MNPCHRHFAIPTGFRESSGVRLMRKLVEIVRHAAKLAHIIGVLFRQPFLHISVSETFPHVLAWRYARLIRPCQQTEVIGCRHLHTDAIAQFFRRFLFRATALVTFLVFLIPVFNAVTVYTV